ncbi:MAG: hypothetical protein AAGK97_13705, partial [Bacteroidota bacterium]
MRNLFIISLILLTAFTTHSQNYLWNHFQSGNYLVDYEAKNKKLIDRNSGLGIADFEVDTVAQKLMILTNDAVQVFDLNGNFERFIPVDYFGEERSLEIDPIRRKIYLIMGTRIVSLNYDGSNLTLLYYDEAEFITDLCIDPIREKMYWLTGFDPEIIRQADLDGSNVRNFYSGPDMRTLQINPQKNVLYFKNITDDEVVELDVATRFRKVLYSFPETTDYVFNMQVDPINEVLYFQTSSPFQFFKKDLKTNEIKQIYNFGHSTEFMRVFRDKMYLHVDSYRQRKISSLDLNTNEINDLIVSEEYLNSFIVDEVNKRWMGTTPFGSIQTADMFGNFTKEHRPMGIDNVTDFMIINDRFVFLDSRRLYSTDLAFEDLKFLTGLEELSPNGLTFNPNDQKIYLVSRWRNNVYRCNLD